MPDNYLDSLTAEITAELREQAKREGKAKGNSALGGLGRIFGIGGYFGERKAKETFDKLGPGIKENLSDISDQIIDDYKTKFNLTDEEVAALKADLANPNSNSPMRAAVKQAILDQLRPEISATVKNGGKPTQGLQELASLEAGVEPAEQRMRAGIEQAVANNLPPGLVASKFPSLLRDQSKWPLLAQMLQDNPRLVSVAVDALIKDPSLATDLGRFIEANPQTAPIIAQNIPPEKLPQLAAAVPPKKLAELQGTLAKHGGSIPTPGAGVLLGSLASIANIDQKQVAAGLDALIQTAQGLGTALLAMLNAFTPLNNGASVGRGDDSRTQNLPDARTQDTSRTV